MIATLEKSTLESLTYTMDFSQAGILATDEVIESITVIADCDVTISEQTFSGQSASFRVAGGTPGCRCLINVLAVTSEDNTVLGRGYLRITE